MNILLFVEQETKNLIKFGVGFLGIGFLGGFAPSTHSVFECVSGCLNHVDSSFSQL